MTVKKGDIVFISQPHHSTPVPGIVLSVLPASAEVWPDVLVHIVSSTDPYAWVKVPHKCYVGEPGYLAADEDEPTESQPKETNNADASEELSEGSGEESSDEGDGSGLVSEEQGASEESDEDGEGEPQEEQEEVDDEREEDESSSSISEEDSGGESVPPTKRKRGGRRGR